MTFAASYGIDEVVDLASSTHSQINANPRMGFTSRSVGLEY
jgi:hypothetical protein